MRLCGSEIKKQIERRTKDRRHPCLNNVTNTLKRRSMPLTVFYAFGLRKNKQRNIMETRHVQKLVRPVRPTQERRQRGAKGAWAGRMGGVRKTTDVPARRGRSETKRRVVICGSRRTRPTAMSAPRLGRRPCQSQHSPPTRHCRVGRSLAAIRRNQFTSYTDKASNKKA